MRIPIGSWTQGGMSAEFVLNLDRAKLGKIVTRAGKNRNGRATALGGAVEILRVSIPKLRTHAYETESSGPIGDLIRCNKPAEKGDA